MALLGNGNNSYLENLNMGAFDITPMVFLLLNGLTDLYWVDASDPDGDYLFNEKQQMIVEIEQVADSYVFYLQPESHNEINRRFEDIELLINYLNK